MNNRISFLTIITLIISTSLPGQTKYFKSPGGKIIDSIAYSKLKTGKVEQFKASFSQVTLLEALTELYRNNDSIIYSYTWNFKMGENKKAEKAPKEEAGIEKYIGETFPIKTLKTIDNKSIGPNDIIGKPTLVNFWFTTCKPCIDEIVALNKIKDTFKDSVNFIAITFENKDVVAKFLSKHNYNYTQIIDAQQFINELNLTGFPVNIFIDKNGKVVSVEGGIPYEINNGGEMKPGDSEKFIKILKELL